MQWECDPFKERANRAKHGVDFSTTPAAFQDAGRVLRRDEKHSREEMRFQCIGHDGHGVLTFTFTLRTGVVRVISAGYFRKGRRIYEKK